MVVSNELMSPLVDYTPLRDGNESELSGDSMKKEQKKDLRVD